MNLKQLYHKYKQKWLKIWHAGKPQRYFHITYDVIWNVILFFLVIGFIGAFFAGGIGMGYFASLVKDEPIRDPQNMKQAIYNYEETSRLYFADDIYFGDIQSDLQRDEVDLENVSNTLRNAVIATEDEYFNTHHGVVPKAIIRALIQEATNASAKSGGSTLTQQLIKNQILTNEVSFERKAKEILLAMRLENFFEKDEIIEAYLNVVPYGREASGQNIAGVQTAAQGIFGVDASDVTLPQAAFLAGLPQNPYNYTPFQNRGGLKEKENIEPGINRMKTVLNRMYQEDYISKEAYQQAANYDISVDFIEEQPSTVEKYPYLTYELQQEAQSIIKGILAKEEGITKNDLEQNEDLNNKYKILADRAIRRDGYNIHSTIDKQLHDTLKKTAKEFDHYGPEWKGKITLPNGEIKKVSQRVETGAYMIDNHTGRTLAFVGGRGYSKESEVNFATGTKRSNGSTMKPLLYGPAMEKGYVQPGSPLLDAPFTYASGKELNNVDGSFSGIVSTRHALTQSINVPAVRLYDRIKSDNLVDEFLRPMGMTSLRDNEYANASLIIGGTTDGITVEENTNAFATYGSGGDFTDAYMIDTITNGDGEVIYEKDTESNTIFSPETNYLMIDVMRDVMDKGTGKYVKSYLNHPEADWFGKTGTSQDYENLWFVGGNPNITFGTWMGYEYPKSLECDTCSLPYYKRSAKLWASMINAAADSRPDVILPEERFERPDGVVERSFCAVSGMLPSPLCEQAGLVKTDLFNAEYAPTEEDDSLMKGSYVMVNGQAVTVDPATPSEFVKGNGLIFNPDFLERNHYNELDDLTDLYSKLNPDAWREIGIPDTELYSSLSRNDGPPSPPSSLRYSGNQLIWKSSGSDDVIGYRIYRADKSGGSFQRLSHTTGQSYSIGNRNGVYQVKAVDYFGQESDSSNQIRVGSQITDSDKGNNNAHKDDGSSDKNKKKDKGKNKDKRNANKNDNHNKGKSNNPNEKKSK